MSTALLVIDCQMEFARRTAAGIARSNPDAETAIANIIAAFRAKGRAVLHVHHDDPNPKSGFRLDKATGAPMPCAQPVGAEPVFVKHGSSAFVGTGLEQHLRANAITHLVIVGAAVNYCVASTVRMASDLGFAVSLVQDAVFGFGVTAPDGTRHGADTVLSVTLGTLAEFGAIVSIGAAMEVAASPRSH
jgi:nicotinamidase-related amidase